MEGQVKTLVELQKIDAYLSDVERAKQELPIRLADMDRELEKATAKLEKLAEKFGWDKLLAETSGGVIFEIYAAIQSGWFQFPAVFVFG